jgi:hypothetical protein
VKFFYVLTLELETIIILQLFYINKSNAQLKKLKEFSYDQIYFIGLSLAFKQQGGEGGGHYNMKLCGSNELTSNLCIIFITWNAFFQQKADYFSENGFVRKIFLINLKIFFVGVPHLATSSFFFFK